MTDINKKNQFISLTARQNETFCHSSFSPGNQTQYRLFTFGITEPTADGKAGFLLDIQMMLFYPANTFLF